MAGGRIAAVRTVVNPEKLRHLPALQARSGLANHRPACDVEGGEVLP